MGYFSGEARTKVVQIDEENSVTIRALSTGEIRRAQGKASAAAAAYGGHVTETGEVVGDIGVWMTEYMRRGILAWEGPNFMNGNGKPVRVTPDNIDDLPPHVFDLLFNEIHALSQGLSEPEKNG
jgi:hypothetical protein